MTNDHDLLIEISGDIKHILEWNKDHKLDDDSKHIDNLKKFEKINKTQDFQNKIIYGGIGILAFLEFISRLIK